MKTRELGQLFSHASASGRFYQKQILKNIHHKKEQVLETFDVSIGVFDGEFEDQKVVKSSHFLQRFFH